MSDFFNALHEPLLPFEILLLYLGLLLFLIFVCFAIRSMAKNIKIPWTYFGILVFSIIMIGFPSVTSLGIQSDGKILVEFNRKVETGEEPITDKEKQDAEKVALKVSNSNRSYPDHTIYESAVTLKNIEKYDLAKLQLSKVTDQPDLRIKKSDLSKTLQIFEASEKLKTSPHDIKSLNFIRRNEQAIKTMSTCDISHLGEKFIEIAEINWDSENLQEN